MHDSIAIYRDFISVRLKNPHIAASITGLTYQVVSILIGLLFTPFLLTHLGAELFGVWALLNTIGAYESISDLGIPAAMTVFIGGSRSNGDRNAVITVGVAMNTLLTVLVIAAFWIFQDEVITFIFRTDAITRESIRRLLWVTVSTLIFLVVARSFSAVLDALQRVHVRFLVDTFSAVGFALFAWAAITRGFGLQGVVIAGFVVGVIRSLLTIVCVIRVHPALRPTLGQLKSIVKRFLRYGVNSQGANLGLSLSDPILKSVVGAGIGPTAVGALQMGSTAAMVPNSVAHSMIGNLFPAIADHHGRADYKRIEGLATAYLLFVAGLVGPLTVFFLVSADDLVHLWLREPYPQVTLALRLTTLGFGLRALAMVPWRISWGMERPQDSSVAMLLNVGFFTMVTLSLLISGTLTYVRVLLIFVGGYAISTLYLYARLRARLPNFVSRSNTLLFAGLARMLLILACLSALAYIAGLVPAPMVVRVSVQAILLILTYVMILLTLPTLRRHSIGDLIASFGHRLRR